MSLYHKFRGFVVEWGWEELTPATGSEPSGNRGGAAFCRDGTGNFCLFGGQTQAGSSLADFWRFDASTLQWTQVVASGMGYTGTIPRAYADGSGNAIIFTNDTRKVDVSTGAETVLTGTAMGGTGYALCADISARTVYAAAPAAFTYESGDTLAKFVQDVSANTTTRTAMTSSVTGRSQHSSPALYPAGNTLYMFSPTSAYNAAWTLSASDIIKYDLTAGTGWVAETGVTNNAGSLSMGVYPYNMSQLVWCAAEAKFFLFAASGAAAGTIGRVLTYDPVTKVLAEAIFNGTPGAYILGAFDGSSVQRGNVGTVVVTSSEFFFVNAVDLAANTNARIWKFRRNA